MSGRTNTRALLHALRALLPGADINVLHERPWHSLTFCGTQLCLSVPIADAKMLGEAKILSQKLSEHEFVLSGQIVADISVTWAVVVEGAQCLIIDALLLDA